MLSIIMSQHLQNKAQLCQILCLTWLLIMADLNRTFLLISRHSQLLLTVNGDAIPAAVYNRRTQKPQCLEKDAPGYSVGAPFYNVWPELLGAVCGQEVKVWKISRKISPSPRSQLPSGLTAGGEQRRLLPFTKFNVAVCKSFSR